MIDTHECLVYLDIIPGCLYVYLDVLSAIVVHLSSQLSDTQVVRYALLVISEVQYASTISSVT